MIRYSVVIPSRNPDNLRACVASIRENEPRLPLSRIIVIDDGARAGMNGEFPAVHWLAGIRPFIFSRAINAGIRHCFPDDVILLNDDARLLTPGGFTALAEIAQSHGIVSAAITGAVGNPNQLPKGTGALRPESRMVCFIAAYIPRVTLDKIGLLDTRFVGYGLDDDDLCFRIRGAGLDIAIFDGCLVEHGQLPSSFRSRPGGGDFRSNLKLFCEKWGHDNFGRLV